MERRDFEAFKANYELFSKIDSPEKLAICKKQYENYLANLESADYFEPETDNEHSGISLKYHTELQTLFQAGEIRENEFYLLVKPSFEPEWLMILSKSYKTFSLQLKELEGSYWDKLYSGQSEYPDLITHVEELPESIGNLAFEILSDCMNEAKKLPGGYHVIDGVKYYLSRRLKDRIETVSKHSPNENSLTGKVISMMTLLAEYARTPDLQKLEVVRERLVELHTRQ